MLNRLPKHPPRLSAILEDLGNPRPEKLAAAMGVTLRTVQRWHACDDAPRPVLLALFWLTRFGFETIDCEAHNARQLAIDQAVILRRENAALRREVARLLAIGDFGAANDASTVRVPVRPVQVRTP